MAKLIKDYSFRELDKGYLFIKSEALAGVMGQFFEAVAGANGVLVYGFIDHAEGLGFEVLAMASLDEGKLQLGQGKDELSLKLKFSDVEEEEAMALPANLPAWERFATKVASVETDHSVTEAVLDTRKVLNLDSCRVEGVPDEVLVYLVKGELVETCQVRLEGIQKMFFVGTLLQEPSLEFGVHEGDSISFYNVKNEQGIMCMAIFPE